jgi:Spy/CpxP family protein refolding chaperone
MVNCLFGSARVQIQSGERIMMKRTFVLALAATIFAFTSGAYAQQRMGTNQEQAQSDSDVPMMGPGMGHMSGHGMGYMMSPAMMQTLGLSSEQKAKISQIQAQARKKQWPVMGDLREERIKLHELMNSDGAPDPTAATAQYQKVQDLERQLFEGALVARGQVEAVLTAEQREKLKSVMIARGMGRPGMGPSTPPGMGKN